MHFLLLGLRDAKVNAISMYNSQVSLHDGNTISVILRHFIFKFLPHPEVKYKFL